jgi:predicted transglutaminase-like cysteine proteinase
MDKNSLPRKKHRLRNFVKKSLCGSFAATAILTSGAVQACVVDQIVTSAVGGSAVIEAFGATANWTPLPSAVGWGNVMQRQHDEMQNPENAKKFRDFLATFDKYKDEPLAQKAANVSADVNKYLTYDNDYPFSGVYWQTPFKTEDSKRGNCHDYAALQYFILRHLGVPEDRLLFAAVNSDGQTTIPNHVILLLNIAPDGQKPNFVVLNNDHTPVVPANDYTRPGTGGWPDRYELFAVFNEQGFWLRPPLALAKSEITTLLKGMSSTIEQITLLGAMAGLTLAAGMKAARLYRAGLPDIASIPKLDH